MKNIYSVGQVNAYIKNMFAQDYMLRSIIVSGEASNVKYHSSGHVYFTMKDKTGAISCVMFAGNARTLNFRLSEGVQIEAEGSVNVYEKSGTYQLYVTSLSLAGAGALYAKYEALKKELEEMGLFDESYKRPIPKYAQKIGVVTAPTGAAIQDIRQISARRNPHVRLILYPALVQGEGAKESIVRGIKYLETAGVDVIIVGRGGGSIEDLWAFNERCVAEAIFDCSVPIISAVGHQVDTTIADYAADLRAPTPSAAAELAVFSYEEFLREIDSYKERLKRAVDANIDRAKGRIDNIQPRLESLSPANKLKIKKMTYVNLCRQLDDLMELRLQKSKNKLNLYIERFKGLSPLEKIQHGFAAVTDSSGNRVKSAEDVKPEDELKLTMRSGVITARVEKVSVYDINDV